MAVTFVFFITDCLFALVMLIVWELPWYFPLAFFIFFGALDGVYLSATLNKVRLRHCTSVARKQKRKKQAKGAALAQA